MFIEDLICEITNTGLWTSTRRTIHLQWKGNGQSFVQSIAEQIAFQSIALTEKQGTLILKVLTENRDDLQNWFPNIDSILESPKWKKPFRVLPTIKKVSIKDKLICVEFPFDQSVVDAFRKRNTTVHELYKGTWSASHKRWEFPLTEINVAYVGDMLINKGFDISDEFLTLYAAVLDTQENIEKHIPMVVKRDDTYSIVNAYNKVPSLPTDNLTDIMFSARNYGITTWDDAVEKDMTQYLNLTTKKILSKREVWIDSKNTSIDAFKELIDWGGPALIIIPGGNEATLVKAWTEFAFSSGIANLDISVMFRLPNDQADFNQYVRETGLNNPVGANTRIAFVSTKITKPLIKSGVEFNTVINLGYYSYMHFTMSTIVDNARNLVYYSMKEPTKNNKWQPHTL